MGVCAEECVGGECAHASSCACTPLPFTHTLAWLQVWWDPGHKLVYYVDGQPTYEISKEALAGGCNEGGQCVADRDIPMEPMHLLLNLALSDSFATVRPDLPLPASMLVDWVRVWQRPTAVDVGCSPPDAPTAQYIACNREKFVLSPGDELLVPQGGCPAAV